MAKPSQQWEKLQADPHAAAIYDHFISKLSTNSMTIIKDLNIFSGSLQSEQPFHVLEWQPKVLGLPDFGEVLQSLWTTDNRSLGLIMKTFGKIENVIDTYSFKKEWFTRNANGSWLRSADGKRVKQTPDQLFKDDPDFPHHVDLMLDVLEASRSNIIFLWGLTAQEAFAKRHGLRDPVTGEFLQDDKGKRIIPEQVNLGCGLVRDVICMFHPSYLIVYCNAKYATLTYEALERAQCLGLDVDHLEMERYVEKSIRLGSSVRDMNGAVTMNSVDTTLKALHKTLSSTEIMKRRERGRKLAASMRHRIKTDPAFAQDLRQRGKALAAIFATRKAMDPEFARQFYEKRNNTMEHRKETEPGFAQGFRERGKNLQAELATRMVTDPEYAQGIKDKRNATWNHRLETDPAFAQQVTKGAIAANKSQHEMNRRLHDTWHQHTETQKTETPRTGRGVVVVWTNPATIERIRAIVESTVFSVAAIGRDFGQTEGRKAMKIYAEHFGEQIKTGWPAKKKIELLDLVDNGETWPDIAAKLRRSEASVQDMYGRITDNAQYRRAVSEEGQSNESKRIEYMDMDVSDVDGDGDE